MKEIEMKILETPKKLVFAQLKKLGVELKYKLFMRVKYFDFKDHSIERRRDLLRLRELTLLPSKKKKTELVYKKYRCIKKSCKVFDELEFSVDGKSAFKNLSALLHKLGFIQTVYFEKKRTSFMYKDIKFEFDEYPKIPPLLEIEAKNAKAVDFALKKLGFEKFEKSPEPIGQLLKRKYNGIKLEELRFR